MDKKPEVKDSRLIYQGYVNLREDDVVTRSGETAAFDVVMCPHEAVAILVETEEKGLLITREYRHAIGEYMESVPGGNIDPGEDLIHAAKRELNEETGFEAPDWELVGVYYPCSAILDQKVHLLIARGGTRNALPHLEPGEWIESSILDYETLQQHIQSGALVDGALLALLYYYR